MFLQRSFKANWFVTFGMLSLLVHAIAGMSRIGYSDEIYQKPSETIGEIISETSEEESSESIEEIIVYGDKPLHTLRREVYTAEENFFDLFTSLNQDDDYDVRCYYEVPSFTHIRRHVCRANFVIDATSAEAASFLGKGGGPALPAEMVIEGKKERFREVIEALVAEHPELLQALSKYTNARQILESEKEQRNPK
jgi:Na+-transporting methylmalonyl-CoA/oxaloacetate decarboxylase gamma subunit